MSKLITDPKTVARMLGTLQSNVDVSEIPNSTAEWVCQHPAEAGEQFTLFLKNGGKVIIGEPRIITITDEFNPETFIGSGWKSVPEETDERGEALKELDLSKAQFETMLRTGETSIKGEEKLRRSKEAGHIRLGGRAFKACWDNRHLLPESWKKDENGNTRYIFFDGIVLLTPNGRRCVLCLCFEDGKWVWSFYWLGRDFLALFPSALLASTQISETQNS